jgi:hypothetical protein
MSTSIQPARRERETEEQSLDLVQRVVVSALVAVVMGLFAAVLAAYLAVRGEHDLGRGDVVGLWLMTGVLGLLTVGAILLINRRPVYHPSILVGLLPMAASAYAVFV